MELGHFRNLGERYFFSSRETVYATELSAGHVVQFITSNGDLNRLTVDQAGDLWVYGQFEQSDSSPLTVRIFRQWHLVRGERPLFQSIEGGETGGPVITTQAITALELGEINYRRGSR